MNTLISFPQGPISDDNNNVTLEWRQWFQNPQVLSLMVAGNATVEGNVTVDGDVDIQEIFNLQTLLATIPNLGASIAKFALSLNATNVMLALQPKPKPVSLDAINVALALQQKFNPSPLSQRIDNITVMGAFV